MDKKDREFILKISKGYGELDKRLKKVEDQLKQPVESPVMDSEEFLPETPRVKRVADLVQKRKDKILKGNSEISLTFKDNRNPDIVQQQILIESLYKTLKEVCYQNDIKVLEITISE